MKEKLNKTNSFLIVISIIIGIALGIFVKSNIPNIVPVTLDDLQKMNEEKHIVENELEEIRSLIEDKEKHLKEMEDLSDYNQKEIINKRLENFKISSGLFDIKGPGIIVTMRDNTATIGMEDDVNLDIIHDSDMLMIVNDLKNAGAEAISINGQRILSSSEIKCGGPIIRVNGKSLGTPFHIKAIGDQNLLKSSITAPTTYGYILKHIDEIDIEYEISDEVQIPAYKGNLYYKYALPRKGR